MQGGQALRLFAALVHGQDLLDLVDGEGIELAAHVVRLDGVVHQPFEDVGLDEGGLAGGEPERVGLLGEVLEGLHVGVQLVVEAALEAAALARQLGLVDGQVLIAGRGGGDGLEAGQPGAAAQLAPAHADAADTGRLLPRADLAHLDLHLELARIVADELAEVHAPLGRVVEGSLAQVALILHVADLHVEVERAGDGAGAHHGRLFELARMAQLLQVALVRLTDDAGLHVLFAQLALAQLQAHQLARQAHLAHVVAVLRFHHHPVARGDALAQRVAVIVLSGAVLEAHFHDIARLHVVDAEARQPVERVEPVAAAVEAASVAAAAGHLAIGRDTTATSRTTHISIGLRVR